MPNSPPEHWTLLTGPAGWFEVWHPPQWQSGQRGPTLTLTPQGSEAVVAFHSLWLGAQHAEMTPSLKSVTAQFPKSRNIRSISDTDLDQCFENYEGQAVLDPPVAWWKQIFKPQPWRRWRMWAFRSGPVLVVVTLIHPTHRDPDVESLVRMMLGTLRITDDPADPPEEFSKRVLALAKRRFPLLECRAGTDFQLHVGESTVNLFNFYRSYVKTPQRFEEIVLPAITTVVQVQEWGDNQTEPPLDAVRERIMPMLYPESVWRGRFPEFVGSPWVGGLAVLYVVDESQAYWYIRSDLLNRWKLDSDDLHDLALRNLEAYFEKQPMELAVARTQDDGPTMLMPSKADSYNAARFLSGVFLSRLREACGGNLAVGLPGRDFFVAVSMESKRMVEDIRRKIHADFEQTDHPLTDKMLLISADGVSELPVEES